MNIDSNNWCSSDVGYLSCQVLEQVPQCYLQNKVKIQLTSSSYVCVNWNRSNWHKIFSLKKCSCLTAGKICDVGHAVLKTCNFLHLHKSSHRNREFCKQIHHSSLPPSAPSLCWSRGGSQDADSHGGLVDFLRTELLFYSGRLNCKPSDTSLLPHLYPPPPYKRAVSGSLAAHLLWWQLLAELLLNLGRSCQWVMACCGHEVDSQGSANCRPLELIGRAPWLSVMNMWLYSSQIGYSEGGWGFFPNVHMGEKFSWKHKKIGKKTCLCRSSWGNEWPGFHHWPDLA